MEVNPPASGISLAQTFMGLAHAADQVRLETLRLNADDETCRLLQAMPGGLTCTVPVLYLLADAVHELLKLAATAQAQSGGVEILPKLDGPTFQTALLESSDGDQGDPRSAPSSVRQSLPR